MRKLTTKGRYAVRILVRIALGAKGELVRVREVAEAEAISPDYIEQILTKLRTAGLVNSRRGVGGGFQLARAAAEITVADVLGATEGPGLDIPCLTVGCPREPACVVHSVWVRAQAALAAVFSGTTIGELADAARRQRRPDSLDYDI